MSFINTVGKQVDFLRGKYGFERADFAYNLDWLIFRTFFFLFWQGLFLDGNRICIVLAFLLLKMGQILRKYDKINNDRKVGKLFFITGWFT